MVVPTDSAALLGESVGFPSILSGVACAASLALSAAAAETVGSTTAASAAVLSTVSAAVGSTATAGKPRAACRGTTISGRGVGGSGHGYNSLLKPAGEGA